MSSSSLLRPSLFGRRCFLLTPSAHPSPTCGSGGGSGRRKFANVENKILFARREKPSIKWIAQQLTYLNRSPSLHLLGWSGDLRTTVRRTQSVASVARHDRSLRNATAVPATVAASLAASKGGLCLSHSLIGERWKDSGRSVARIPSYATVNIVKRSTGTSCS